MTAPRYSPWTRHLHWVVFILVACALVLIYINAWTPRSSPLHANARWAHMQFGMAILLVMLPRLLVRSRATTAPPITPPLPAWQKWAAKCMHLALYVLLIVTPLLGIANRMWSPGAWNLLGIPMPHVAHPERAFSHMLEGIHGDFGNILMYLAALHATMALFHHFAQRDNTLKRMLPAQRSES
ncbi:MAG TPA: cytochrome b [Rhodanobacteraceae bacterium]|jgi:cytochrome b561|nr:cytochrome b [Rhodanobacteraceae bacterium]